VEIDRQLVALYALANDTQNGISIEEFVSVVRGFCGVNNPTFKFAMITFLGMGRSLFDNLIFRGANRYGFVPDPCCDID
jgi:hypothetical protein